jgi:hypothetical protein
MTLPGRAPVAYAGIGLADSWAKWSVQRKHFTGTSRTHRHSRLALPLWRRSQACGTHT